MGQSIIDDYILDNTTAFDPFSASVAEFRVLSGKFFFYYIKTYYTY